MASLDKMSLKEKDYLLKSIIKEYSKAKIQLKVLEGKEFYPTQHFGMIVKEDQHSYNGLENAMMNHIDKKDALKSMIRLVDDVFESLNDEQRLIIENDYLKPNYKEWWRQYYSRSTFYRMRKKAIDDMLYYLIR